MTKACRAIKEAPLAQQDNIAKALIGLTVTCLGLIASVTPLQGGKAKVGIMSRPEDMDVYFEVDIAKYPGLATIKAEAAHVQVTGRVASISAFSAQLLSAELVFL